MKIDKNLHLVYEIERDDGAKIFVHSTPISREVYDTFWEVIGLTYTKFVEEGPAYVLSAGPRVADKMLKKVATAKGQWDSPGGVAQGLLPEIRRLTNVLIPGARGWETYPLDDAKSQKLIDAVDTQEVESRAIFFTVLWHTLTKKEREITIDPDTGMEAGMPVSVAKASGARIESLNCTEFTASLRTLTAGASTGVRAVA